MKCITYFFVFCFCWAQLARASTVNFATAFLAADLRLGEQSTQAAGFHLGPAFVALEWQDEHALGAHLSLGSEQLNFSPRWYQATYAHKSIFYQAYAFHKGPRTRWQIGLQEVLFGLESHQGLAYRDLEDSLFLQQKYISYNDLGLSWQQNWNSAWYSRVLLHNGYGVQRSPTQQNDNRYFVTASLWRQSADARSRWGLSLQRGDYSRESQSEARRVQIANLFFIRNTANWSWFLEAHHGSDAAEGVLLTEFQAWSLALQCRFSQSYSILARAEQLRADIHDSSADQKAESVALLYHPSPSSGHRLKLEYRQQQGPGLSDRVVLLGWRMSAHPQPEWEEVR